MTTATRTEDDVKSDILRAMADGDDARVRTLQEEFRTSGFPVIRLSPEPPRLIEGPTRSRQTATPAAARSTSRSPLADVLRAPALGAVPSSRLTVVLTALALDSLRTAAFDGLETGGFLYGRVLGDEIRVENLTEVHDTRRTQTHVVLDRDQLRDWADHFRAAGWTALGDWHSHPSLGDEIVATPSETDRVGWRACAERARTLWLGLLLFPHRVSERDGDVWGQTPGLSMWVTAPGASVTSPARLVIETEAT